MKKTIIANIIIAALLPFTGLLLLMAVYMLPTGKMVVNVSNSMSLIESEFENELAIDGYKATMTGSFTDCLMLEHAIYNGNHSKLNQAMNMYRAESCPDDGEWWPGLSLRDYINGVEQPREVEYSRYWHGYLVVLKPMLMLFSLNSIRLFNLVFQLALLSMILIELSKKGYSRVAISLAAASAFMFFGVSYNSLSLSICLYLMLLGLLIQVYLDEKITKINGYFAFFLIMGAATSYFDFLTYPIVTFGFPVCVYLCMHKEKIKERLIKFAVFGGLWGFGYIYMWASKWIFSDILAGNSTIKDALFTVGVRTGSDTVSFIKVIEKNLSVYLNRPYLILLALVLVLAIIWIIKDIKFVKKINILNSIPLMLMVIAPFVWWMVTQNHSGQHWVFTCRIFSLSVFALLCVCSQLITDTEGRKDAL